MFQSLQRYNGYEGVPSPWLPDLPSHWRMERAKSLLVERVERGHPDEPLLAATQSHGVIRKSDYGNRTVTATKDLHLLKLVERGDFVISLRSFQGGIERCYHRGIISPAYTVLTATSNSYRDYLTYLFKSKPFVTSLTLAVTGIREGQNIDYSRLSVERLPVPPAEEQTAIVRYLTHANARIDKAITAKRRLIALLEEQRRATTGRLVVGQGIHDDLSETGSKWFPTLPANWDVVQLGRVIQFAIDGPHFSPNYLDEGIPFLSARNIRTDRWLLEDIKYVSERDFADFNRRVQPQPEDVLYTKGGTTGVARVVDLDFPFQIWVHVAVLRPRNWIVEPRYLALALNSPKCYEQAQLETRGATNQDLGLGRMKRIELPLPPLDQQRRLVSEHAATARGLYMARARIEREIALLAEFRTRLVADVVTGQVDVRGLVASLPEIDPAASWGDSGLADGIDPADFDDVMEANEV